MRNYANVVIFVDQLAGRPMTGDRSSVNLSIHHMLSPFYFS